MFRAMSTRRGGRTYERLTDESSSMCLLEVKLMRSTTVPSHMFGSPRKLKQELDKPAVVSLTKTNPPAIVKQAKKVSKIHPLFAGLFDGGRSRKKRATAKPEFARYMEYVKEGGVWDANSNMPAIFYK